MRIFLAHRKISAYTFKNPKRLWAAGMVNKVTSPGQGRGPSRHGEQQKHHLLPLLMKESLSWEHISEYLVENTLPDVF